MSAVPEGLIDRFRLAARTIIRERKEPNVRPPLYAEDVETLAEVMRVLEGSASAEKVVRAAREVEAWWLSDGMHAFNAAPACIFNLRAALNPEWTHTMPAAHGFCPHYGLPIVNPPGCPDCAAAADTTPALDGGA